MKIGGLTVLLCLALASAAKLQRSGCYKGYCFAYLDATKDNWCYTTHDKAGKTYARCPPDGKTNCKEWDGYSSNDYCRAGSAGRATGAGGAAAAAAEDTGGGWKCSKSWSTGAGLTAEEGTWTAGINVYRCMHDVQFARWDHAVANNLKNYLAPLTGMRHSNSYDIPPPAGPAGENLFWGSGSWTSGDSLSSWYSEVKDCGAFPGCGGGSSHGTGHFTAMVWAGANKIGCSSNAHGLKACRFKGSDTKDCTTPNMGGCYAKNVPAAKRSLASCKAKVQSCMGSSGGIKLFSLGEGMQTGAEESALGGMMSTLNIAALALALVGAVVVVHRRVTRRPSEQASEVELLEEAPEE